MFDNIEFTSKILCPRFEWLTLHPSQKKDTDT